MVKKSKFLDKIVNRFRSGSLKVESEEAPVLSRGRPVQAESQRTDLVQPVPEEIVPDSRRKLTRQEDATLLMTKSFGELASLLRGVQVRMEDQGGRIHELGQSMGRLPATAEAQLEVLKSLVTQLDKQNQVSGQMVKTFAELPDVMKGIRTSLEKAAATDSRTAQTLDEFKSTMDRIQHSMGDMVTTNKVQADATAKIAGNHQDTVRQFEQTTQEGLKALRWAQEDQANRMVKLVGESGKWNRAILVLMIMSFAALVAIFGALIGG